MSDPVRAAWKAQLAIEIDTLTDEMLDRLSQKGYRPRLYWECETVGQMGITTTTGCALFNATPKERPDVAYAAQLAENKTAMAIVFRALFRDNRSVHDFPAPSERLAIGSLESVGLVARIEGDTAGDYGLGLTDIGRRVYKLLFQAEP